MKLELRELKKGIALLTIATMVLTLFPVSSYAFQATDLSKHWAKDIIGPWMSQNLVKGYEDGTFRPDNNITRAEFMSLVNGAFGFTEIEEIQYTDVEEGGWYKKTIETAKAAAYISGYPDNTMRPNHPIGRAEAASIIMKLCSLETPPADVVKFTDASNFGWAKAAINAVATANIMNGYPDGSFQPQRFIKRAEAVAALDKALSYCKGNHTYQTAGTYGPSSGNEQIEGNVTVNEKDIILQNLVIQGNLTIGKNVGDGTVTLKNVTVKGKTMINGGGENSILVIDSSLGAVTVSREGGKIRIVVSGHTSVNLVQALSGVKLEEKDLSDGSPGFRELVLDASDDDSIVLNGSFDKVTVESEDLKLQLSKGSTVETFIVDKKISVTGTGTIGTALIHASGVTLETAPKTLKVDPGIAAPTIGEAASGSGGGGGGGGGVQPQPAISVEEVSISGNLFVGQALTAKLKPEAATASYHWMRSDAANGTYQDILNATGKTYQLTDADYNQYIKVRIEGTGDYTGAKTSNPIAQPVDKEKTAAPMITPSKNTAVNRESGINFTIDTVEGVTYYYTLDGSRPTEESSRYEGSTALTAPNEDGAVTVTINMIGVKAGAFDSEMATAVVTYSAKETVARPTITPSKTTAVNRESGINFTIDTVEGVIYYYTLDGSRPTTESSRYQGDITLAAPDQDAEAVVAINVIGVKAGSFDSEVATAAVTYSAKETVARPTITPSKTTAVNRESGINFTIDTVEGVIYYYTLDGSRPTTESSRYQGDITLAAPDQDAAAVVAINVIGVKAGSFDSEVATATVTYSAKETVARPTITPSKTTAVNRESGINFTIDTVEGVAYYYTLDGLRPTAESDRYQGPTTLTAPNEDGAVTVPINVIGIKAGAFDSEVATATVTYSAKETVARPIITPSKTTAVNRESGINFTIDTVEGVIYYYTLDGSRPTAESNRYQGSTTLTAPNEDGAVTVTINMIGVKSGAFDSEMATATVTYSAKETVARPTITPSKTTAVNRESGISFTIDTVEGVAYYYTLDGSRPTAESNRYQGSTTLTAPNEDGAVTVTINVIGVKAGAFDSEMATATVTYSAKETVARPTITPSKTTAVNRESGINFTIDTVEGVAYYYTLDGSRPTAESDRYQGSTTLTAPNEDGAVTVAINVIGVKAGSFDSEVATAAVTYSAKETVARPTITPSKTTAVNRESGINFTIDTVEGVAYYYTLDGSRPTEESDRYQGATTLTAPDQDAEAVVAINVIGVKAGSFDSEVATATVTYSAKETVARPTITPSKTTAVNRESGINFTIDTVGGVTYYYTLDGSRPTEESSRYEGTTTLTAPNEDGAVTVTINVIGVKAGEFDSEMATAAVTYSARISQAVSVVFIPAEAAPGGTYFPSQGYSAETINRIEESLWGLAEPFTLSTAAGPLEIKKIFSTSNGGNTLTINADNVTQSFLDWLEHDLATSGRKALQVQLSAGSATFYQDSEDRNIINGSEGTPLFLLLSGYPDWEGTTIRINFHDLRQGENRGGLMLSDGTEAPFVVETIGNLKPADSIQINGPTAITEDDGELQLSAEVFPQDAYNKTVKWSVVNGAGYARISNSGHGTTGRLYAGKNGIVEVYATSAQDGALVSAPFTITITGQLGPAAPTGIDVIGESIMGTGDGGLTGVAPGQEYQLVGTEVWTPITGSTVTGLAPGSYIVRVAETEMQPAGMPTGELVVEVGSDFEEPRSTVERDPEETGGSSVTFDPSTFTFNGTIAYYEQTALIGGDRPGNYIGVKITAPDSIDVDQAAATFTYTDTDGNEQTLVNGTTVWMSGADYMYYYPLVTSSDQTYTVMIDWDGSGTAYNPETIVIRVDNAILLPADPLPPESGGSDSGTEPGGEDDNTDAENDGEKEVDLLPEPIVPSKEEITNEPVNFEPVKQELNREVLIPDEKKLLMPAPNAETPVGLTGKVNYGRGTLIKPIGKK